MAEMDLGELKAHLRAPGGTSRRHWRCLSETMLASFADGRLDGEARAKAGAHLSKCMACREQIADLTRMADSEIAPSLPPGLLFSARQLAAAEPRRTSMRLWRWSAAASALAVLVLSMTLKQARWPVSSPAPVSSVAPRPEGTPTGETPQLPQADQPPPDKSRRTSSSNAVPELLAPREGETVAGNQIEFRWTPVPGTVFYEVEVLTADGNIVWASRAQTAHLYLPRQTPLKPGKYFVWVRAHLADGKTRKSKAVRLQITGEQ